MVERSSYLFAESFRWGNCSVCVVPHLGVSWEDFLHQDSWTIAEPELY